MTAAEEGALYKNRAQRKQAAEGLYEAAQNGAKALDEGDAAAYLSTLEAREKLIERMDALEAAYAAAKAGASESARAALEGLEEETRQLLRNVRAADGAAREKAEALMEEYRGKLKSLKKSGKQVTGYTKMYRQSDGIYIDKKR